MKHSFMKLYTQLSDVVYLLATFNWMIKFQGVSGDSLAVVVQPFGWLHTEYMSWRFDDWVIFTWLKQSKKNIVQKIKKWSLIRSCKKKTRKRNLLRYYDENLLPRLFWVSGQISHEAFDALKQEVKVLITRIFFCQNI